MPTSTRLIPGILESPNKAQRILNFRRAVGEVKFRILAGDARWDLFPNSDGPTSRDRARVPRADLEFWADFRSIFAIEISRGGGPPPPLSSNQALLRGGGTLHVQKRL